MATTHGKKFNNALAKRTQEQVGSQEALNKIKEMAFAKFDESVDVNINLGIDPTKGDQVVRGSTVLPHGAGKEIKIAVFAKGDYAIQAKDAGADFVGDDDLIEKVSKGWTDFTYAVATPDMMGQLGKVAKILGPRGLLPNKKLGTVTFEVASVIKDLKQGRQFFKNNKSGAVNFTIGKVSFSAEKLHENLAVFIKALMASKPAASKGKFMKNMTLSSTMGPGITINPDEFVRSA